MIISDQHIQTATLELLKQFNAQPCGFGFENGQFGQYQAIKIPIDSLAGFRALIRFFKQAMLIDRVRQAIINTRPQQTMTIRSNIDHSLPPTIDMPSLSTLSQQSRLPDDEKIIRPPNLENVYKVFYKHEWLSWFDLNDSLLGPQDTATKDTARHKQPKT